MRPEALVRRLVRGLATLPVVFTAVFLSLSFVSNPNTSRTFSYAPRHPTVVVSRLPRFAAREASLPALYGRWAGRLLQFDFGRMPGEAAASVSGVVVDSLGFTAVYFLPAVVIALLAGTAVQLYAVATETRLDWWTRLVAVVAVSVPVFLLAYFARTTLLVAVAEPLDLNFLAFRFEVARGPLAPENLRMMVFPFVATTVYLTAIQMRYAGSELNEHAERPFVKVARAKGAGPLRVGWHILPHTVVHLATAFFTDMLGMVLVGIYVVEWLTLVPGFGALTIDAVGARVPGLVFAVVLLPVTLAVGVNLVQDLYYALIDPRVDDDGSGVGE
ncbi:ABC transporter permease subunit [Halobaculum sp. MBLA0147]|uniref:ABC transporter permease subunit n=1 Tax=Halobaculum sp. MBLA0147 TaxID=3079934 RepID=UPI003526A80B